MRVRAWRAPRVAETTLPPPDGRDTVENVHASISASAVEVGEMRGEEMVATEDGVRVIGVMEMRQM